MDRLDLDGPWGGPCLSPPPPKRQEKQIFSFFFTFWLHCVFAPEPELSLVAVTGGSSLVVVLRLLIVVVSLLQVLDSTSQAQPFGTCD